MGIVVEHWRGGILVGVRVAIRAMGLSLAAFTIVGPIAQAECTGPAALAAKIHDHPDVDAYANLGMFFAQQQNFACANEAFRSAVKLDPNSAKLNYFLGLSLYSSRQPETAVTPLQQSIRSDAKAMQPRVLLATALTALGRKDEAEGQWRAALAIDPASGDALDGLANLLTDGGNPQAAIELLRSVNRDEDLNLDLARAYAQAGRLDDASAILKPALAADPSSLRVTNSLATVYANQHRLQEAAALLLAYVTAHPDDVHGQLSYLRALALTGNNDEARPLAKKLLVAFPHDTDVLLQNGRLEREAGEYGAARDHLREAVALRPESYDGRYNLGATLARMNDAAGAKEQLLKAIAIDPTKPEAHFQLAAVLRTLGDSQAAAEQLKLYAQLNHEREASLQASLKSEEASHRLEAGETAQAIALYREAVAATPENALLHYQLAMALDKSSDFAGERGSLEAAVKIDATFALAQNQLGFLLAREGNAAANAAAEEHFRLAVKAAPEFAVAWINLASTLGSETHYTDAQEAIATALRLDPNNAEALGVKRQLDAALAHK